MGFSSARYDRKNSDRPWKVHPIWRGIGCILLIVVPILSYMFARVFMVTVDWFAMPIELSKPVIFSYYDSRQIDSIVFRINDFLNGELLYGDLFFTVIFMILGFGVLSIIYGFIYRLIGPPRYGPLDSPPTKHVSRRRY